MYSVTKNKSKKLLWLSAAIIIFLIAGCSNGSTPASNPPIDDRAIVCFGDSLTEGFGASRPGSVDKSKSYPAFLQSKVNVNVVNAGISGDTTADSLARLEKDVISINPQMVIVILGGNDFLNRQSAANAKDNYKAIINRLKSENIKVYFAGFIGDADWEAEYLKMIPEFLVPDTLSRLNQYKDIYASLHSENPDIGYISNIWAGIGLSEMSDLIHPNEKGYKKMAETIFTEIKPYLQENSLVK